MSKRYIDADKIVITAERGTSEDGLIFIPMIDVHRNIDATPTADVEAVRHGEWGFDGLGWTCSECGEYALTNKSKVQVHSTYCPHCGAKMDGEKGKTK